MRAILMLFVFLLAGCAGPAEDNTIPSEETGNNAELPNGSSPSGTFGTELNPWDGTVESDLNILFLTSGPTAIRGENCFAFDGIDVLHNFTVSATFERPGSAGMAVLLIITGEGGMETTMYDGPGEFSLETVTAIDGEAIVLKLLPSSGIGLHGALAIEWSAGSYEGVAAPALVRSVCTA